MSITEKQVSEVVNMLAKQNGVGWRQGFAGNDRHHFVLSIPTAGANFDIEGIRSGKLKLKQLVEILAENIENCSAMMRGRTAEDWFENNRRVDFMFGSKEEQQQRAERLGVRLGEASDALMKLAIGAVG